MHLTTESHVSWDFLPNILLRGHNCFCSLHPRLPSPPGAAGPRNRCLWRLPRAAVCCLRSRGPRQATGRTQPNEGEEIRRKFWAPQKSKFWKLWPLTNPPWTWETLCFWGSFDDIELVEKGHVNQIGSQNALRKLKKCSVSKKTNMRAIGTQQNLKSVPCSRYFV